MPYMPPGPIFLRNENGAYLKVDSSEMDAFINSCPDNKLNRRTEDLELLERFANFLEKHGYTDTDWRSEPPTAIDEFMKEEGR